MCVHVATCFETGTLPFADLPNVHLHSNACQLPHFTTVIRSMLALQTSAGGGCVEEREFIQIEEVGADSLAAFLCDHSKLASIELTHAFTMMLLPPALRNSLTSAASRYYRPGHPIQSVTNAAYSPPPVSRLTPPTPAATHQGESAGIAHTLGGWWRWLSGKGVEEGGDADASALSTMQRAGLALAVAAAVLAGVWFLRRRTSLRAHTLR